MWQQFLACLVEQKKALFDGIVDHASSLIAHIKTEGTLMLSSNDDIVEMIIGDLLFDLDDEVLQSMHERALAIFK